MPVSLRNPTPGTETPALTVGGAEELGLCSGPQGRSGAPHVRLVRSEDPVPSASTQMYTPRSVSARSPGRFAATQFWQLQPTHFIRRDKAAFPAQAVTWT